ncbi:MAG TPA: hypothetical protein VH080_08330 [Gemmatimonadaceae bacterium]|nr:hypothetical protein [Gemmatimonadaceae bacterium]
MSAIETVLWQHHGVTCTSLVFDRDHIEITLTVNDELVARAICSDEYEAARCIIDMMHDHAGD